MLDLNFSRTVSQQAELEQLETCLIPNQPGTGAILLRIYEQKDEILSLQHTQVFCQNEIAEIKEKNRIGKELSDSTKQQYALLESLDSFTASGKSIWYTEWLIGEGIPKQ